LIKTIFSGKNIGVYNLEVNENLQAGIYFVRLTNNDKQEIQKIIVLQN